MALWSSGRQSILLCLQGLPYLHGASEGLWDQRQPKAQSVLWVEVGRYTWVTFRWGWFGWKCWEGRGQNPGSLIWPVLKLGQCNYGSFAKGKAGRFCSHTPVWLWCRYIFPCATTWPISSALCYCEQKSVSTLTFRLPHRWRIKKNKNELE